MCEIYALQQGMHRADSQFMAQAANLMGQCDTLLALADLDLESRRELGQVDAAFHLHFMCLWPNQTVLAWYRQIDVQLRNCVMIEVGWASVFRRESIPAEHHALYEAVGRQDIAAAINVVCRHLNSARESLVELRRHGTTSRQDAPVAHQQSNPSVAAQLNLRTFRRLMSDS